MFGKKKVQAAKQANNEHPKTEIPKLNTIEIPADKETRKLFPFDTIKFGFRKDGEPYIILDLSSPLNQSYDQLNLHYFDPKQHPTWLNGTTVEVSGEAVKFILNRLKSHNVKNILSPNHKQLKKLKKFKLWSALDETNVIRSGSSYILNEEQSRTYNQFLEQLEPSNNKESILEKAGKKEEKTADEILPSLMPDTWVKLDDLYIFLNAVNVKYTIPEKTILSKDLVFNENTLNEKSANTVREVTINSFNGYFKELKSNQVAEAETANAGLFRAALGINRCPNIFNVYNGITKEGNISFQVPGFISAKDYYQLNKKNEEEQQEQLKQLEKDGIADVDLDKNLITIKGAELDRLVKAGVADFLVASYIFEENDVNDQNWGFNTNGEISVIDKDQAAWPLTCIDKNRPPDDPVPFKLNSGKLVYVKPKEAFLINPVDIKKFPILEIDATKSKPPTHCCPTRWPDAERGRINVSLLANHPEFIEKKWEAFIKILILDEAFIKQTFKVSMDPKKSPEEYQDHILERFKNLHTTLLKIPEFKKYFEKNKEIFWKNISAHYEKLNQDLAEEDKQFKEFNFVSPKIDLNAIKKNFDSFLIAPKIALDDVKEKQTKISSTARIINSTSDTSNKKVNAQPTSQIKNQPVLKPPVKQEEQPKGFLRRHGTKILVVGIVVAAIVVAGVFTLGFVPAIAGVVAGVTGLVATSVTAQAIAIGGAAAVGAAAGSAVSASVYYGTEQKKNSSQKTQTEKQQPLILNADADDEPNQIVQTAYGIKSGKEEVEDPDQTVTDNPNATQKASVATISFLTSKSQHSNDSSGNDKHQVKQSNLR